MLVSMRHHSPLSVRGPKSAPNAMACCGVGSKADTPLRTMTANTNTFRAMSERVTGTEFGKKPAGGGGAPMASARCWSHAGQWREEGETEKLRLNSLPQVAQRWRDMRERW